MNVYKQERAFKDWSPTQFQKRQSQCRSNFFFFFLNLLFNLGRPFSAVKHCFSKVPRKPVNKGVCYVNQKHWDKLLLFHDKCYWFFYVQYFNNLVHGTYSLTSHPKDESMVKWELRDTSIATGQAGISISLCMLIQHFL